MMAGGKCLLRYLVAVLVATIVFVLVAIQAPSNLVPSWRRETSESIKTPGATQTGGPVTVVVATCGGQFDITMANLKFLVAFSRAHLRLLLFSDAQNIQHLQDTLQEWPTSVLERVTYDLRLIRLPKSLGGPLNCTYQRIFIPRLLLQEDAVLYVDSDAVFFHPVEDLWNYFGQMNDQQLAVVFSDVEDEALNIYNYWEMPHYKRYVINAGVMLMNLTRMRNSGMDALLRSWMYKYRHKALYYHDQDIINTVFHHHPENVFHGPCKWNFVHLVCLSNISCRGETPALIHGTYKTFSDPYRVPAYRVIGQAMQQYRLGTSLERGFIDALEDNLRRTERSVCADKIRGFVMHWRRLARQLDIERGWNTTEAATTDVSSVPFNFI